MRTGGSPFSLSIVVQGNIVRTVYERELANATKIERQICQTGGKIVSGYFGPVCKLLWPFKTAAQLAAIANTNERTAARWLSGEYEPPNVIVLAVMSKIFEQRNTNGG